MDPVIKRIPDLRAAEPLKSSDLLVVSQYIQGAHKVRKLSIAKIKEAIIAGFPNDPTGGGSGGNGTIVVDQDTVAVRINNNEFIQWSFEDGPWYNLIKLSDLRAAAVPTIRFFTGNGALKSFGPVPGLLNNDPNRCLVVVGGVTQRPTISYTVNIDNGGAIIFDEAPPANNEITVQPY